MSEVIKSLLPTLARLTDAEKDELRGLLAAGDDEPDLTQAEWEEAWDEECGRRLAAIDRGEMETFSADEVFRRTREKYG